MTDQEAAGNSEIVKRQRKWNAEGLKVSGQQAANHSASTTPKDAFPTPAKRTFSRSESITDQESPKERVGKPSPVIYFVQFGIKNTFLPLVSFICFTCSSPFIKASNNFSAN